MIEIAMTPQMFAAKAAQLKAEEGIDLTVNAGTVEKSGVKASYTYDGATLTVTILSKPWLVTTGYCENKMLAWLAGS